MESHTKFLGKKCGNPDKAISYNDNPNYKLIPHTAYCTTTMLVIGA